MKYYMNPLNINYRYQFSQDARRGGAMQICRESADPSMIFYKGRYYIFASMTLGVWVSDDLVHWENHRLPDSLPLYDYAPDVRVVNGWVYFCASSREHICDRWRTNDILNGPYEKLEGTFSYWDPNVFQDDDGRVYFYWGCSSSTPIYGVELDPETMNPITEAKAMIEGHPFEIGYERIGEDNSIQAATDEEAEKAYQDFVKQNGGDEAAIPEDSKPFILGMLKRWPYIEGAWMTKHDGRYYLQYAAPGTQYNTYSDGVYVGDSPLGPFTLAAGNPYSYKPGGFIPGAGHGSTMEDQNGNFWHAATMRISKNHDFERRVGLWPAGFDEDGTLFCNQRYGDWPMRVSGTKEDPWREPEWYLLSVGKQCTASSCTEGHEPAKASEENVRTWWQAAGNSRDEWLCMDLGNIAEVHAVQINFADDGIDVPCPGELRPGWPARCIEARDWKTQWKLEGSLDGEQWFVLEDKREAETDLSHDLLIWEEGRTVRYLRLSGIAVPYEQNPCISGLRVFGRMEKDLPAVPAYTVKRTGDLDLEVTIEVQENTSGYLVLFGESENRLYHSYMVFAAGTVKIGALIKGTSYVVRVDAFNEAGIVHGTCKKAEE